ncbi:MAG TPA: FKBP-type peptidyl-prolyl cis-trans isomerase [Chitinophagales bacterium]|nr:FKBP-type peptidyl-prolyl cis-trans isomerase [Chitinophagales bacterium]
MLKKLVLILLPVMAFLSCDKNGNCPEVTSSAPASEVVSLKSYLDANSITATEDPRGFFYTIAAAGSGDKPTACSGVTVNYTGKLTNGVTFDDGTGVSFYLSQLITGWQEGIPLIAPGGSITLYLPPSLAYGSAGSSSIPPNSNLIFIIDLEAIY